MKNKTRTVTSKDGTRIAFEQSGEGPAVILVLGAFNARATGRPLAQYLKPHFSVFNYDRRGRGDSTDTAPYVIEREIEDLQALLDEAGGSAYVFGYSSGAVLALRAAGQGRAITRLALYEPPPTGERFGSLTPRLEELVSAGRRGDAVELFQIEGVGIPPDVVAQLRNAPFRPGLEQMAPTLVYESMILQTLPAGLVSSVRTPTLVIDGEKGPDLMHHAAQSLAEALPDGQYRSLAGQTHDIDPTVVGPVLNEFFLA